MEILFVPTNHSRYFIKLDIKPVQVLKTLEKWITNGLLSECPVTADRNDTRDILCKMATVVHKYIPKHDWDNEIRPGLYIHCIY